MGNGVPVACAILPLPRDPHSLLCIADVPWSLPSNRVYPDVNASVMRWYIAMERCGPGSERAEGLWRPFSARAACRWCCTDGRPSVLSVVSPPGALTGRMVLLCRALMTSLPNRMPISRSSWSWGWMVCLCACACACGAPATESWVRAVAVSRAKSRCAPSSVFPFLIHFNVKVCVSVSWTARFPQS